MGPDAFLVKLELRIYFPSEHKLQICPLKLFVYLAINITRAGKNTPVLFFFFFPLRYREDCKQLNDERVKPTEAKLA